LLVPGSAAGQTDVLFDEGHGQRFLIGRSGELDLSDLRQVFAEAGLDVRNTTVPLTSQHLAPARALVISGPFAPLRLEEIAAIVDYVRGGGTLVTMLHIASPLSELLGRLGVVHSNGVVREREGVLNGDPLNFRVTRLEPHPLTRSLREFSIYGSWALLNEGDSAQVVAASGPHSWVDLDGDRQLSEGDAVQSFGLVVSGELGRGRFLVFGDDTMFQNRFLVGSNLELARNLASWVATTGETGHLAASDPVHGPRAELARSQISRPF
jgi:hypothetical protein